jgi:hypothetical protein
MASLIAKADKLEEDFR